MDISFREIDFEDKADGEKAVLLLNEFMNQTEKCTREIDISIIEKMQNLGFAKIYFSEVDRNIMGIAVCFKGFSTYKQKELLNIHDFYLQKNYQGNGIGKLFLEFIEKECIKNDFCRVTLEVYGDNSHAIKLYKKSGYVGSEDTKNSCLIYAMKKDLF